MATITITGSDRSGAALSGRSLRSAVGAAAQSLSMALALWHERACQRHQLLGLGDAALKDFAASRADADFEGGKTFWRA